MTTQSGSARAITQWNWLVMTENRSEYYCPPGLVVTNEEFRKELSAALVENGLPATAELVDVNWDASGTVQRRTLVKYTGSEQSRDILHLFVGVDQVGRFVYVETKTCVRQPELPAPPRKQKPEDMMDKFVGGMAGIMGIVATVGVCGALFGSPGALALTAVAAVFIVLAFTWKSPTVQWNSEAATEQKAWDAAWEVWADKRLRMAYLKRTDDILGRYSAAVMSTVNQVSKKLLIDRDAELRKQTEEQRKLEEIEQEMANRRKQSMA